MALDREEGARLVAWICWYASEQETVLTTVQLVKYLYLADLYNARLTGGQTLTAWPWAFVHFGPYCTEAMNALDHAAGLQVVLRDRYESRYEDKDYFLFRPAHRNEPQVPAVVPFRVQSGLKAAIKKWADDTAGLLDYVYFDTEPMKGIEPRAKLDFSSARLPSPPATTQPLKLSVKKLRKGREILARLRARTLDAQRTTEVDTGPHDDVYFEAMSTDESGETPRCKIIIDISGVVPAAEDDL